jgi:hypothetical protein
MTTPPPTRLRTILSWIGLVVCRVLVPVWIGTGATFKLVESNPGLLPRKFLGDAKRMGLDLDLVLAAIISIEFAAVAVLLFVGRFARLTAVLMMTAFCLVLVREIAAGSTDCGCLGSKSPSPTTMLAIDGALLILAAAIKPRPVRHLDEARWPIVAASALAAAGIALSFAIVLPWNTPA